MRKLLLLVAALMSTLTVFATDSFSLVFRSKDGTETKIPAAGLRMNVADGKLIVASAGNQAFNIADLASMRFIAFTSGLTSDFAAGDTAVEVFNLSGISMGSYNSVDEFVNRVSETGVYLVRSSAGTAKIVVTK